MAIYKNIYIGDKKISEVFYSSSSVWSNMVLAYKSDSNITKVSIPLEEKRKYIVYMDKGGAATLEYNVYFAKKTVKLSNEFIFSTEQGSQLFYLTSAYPIKIYEYEF